MCWQAKINPLPNAFGTGGLKLQCLCLQKNLVAKLCNHFYEQEQNKQNVVADNPEMFGKPRNCQFFKN
jgi:hypothetical protein